MKPREVTGPHVTRESRPGAGTRYTSHGEMLWFPPAGLAAQVQDHFLRSSLIVTADDDGIKVINCPEMRIMLLL